MTSGPSFQAQCQKANCLAIVVSVGAVLSIEKSRVVNRGAVGTRVFQAFQQRRLDFSLIFNPRMPSTLASD